ncbi:MAG: hypothetical protein A3D74_01540 [Candidatus Levybacteria bacterium RIFCSPHIGHO2_02_FULL_37_13]|nr:MAG: hypothetical protein A3D74_01540 [Candidatus Levybacteria bacterium RIFCSPHIGHO2_02_FULL_37_13]OGH29981.1 MAG: hypothetical protein A3E40_04940 [Candidatus Levybacteria bacterium RIFCSPHIGHO2_12_FULL_37_9]
MFGTLTILIIILAIFITAQNTPKKDQGEVISDTIKPSSTPTSTLTPSQNPNDTPTIVPPTLTPTSTPASTNIPNFDNQTNADFKYPNSTTISQSGSETAYESSDDPKKITDWYKKKIKSIGMKATSFVQTSTNGNVLNKLVGASQNQEVRVEISKQNNSSLVKIVVVTD